MAMLAEKKRREKWCLNPHGKAWSKDQSKFGQRLLEKMGWNAGQGLGVNNQGPTEIIKVKKKDDNTGLGFKENGEEWLKKTSDFTELLDQLGSSVQEGTEVKTDTAYSLEDRSKKSRARVHYHKFTRGKDLSRYSEKDLASIIGPEAVKSKPVDESDPDYASNQVNKGSLEEYFNSKKKSKQSCLTPHSNSEKIERNVNEEMSNKELVFNEKETSKGINENTCNKLSLEVKFSTKKIKSKKSKNNENILEENIDVEEKKTSKKKKKKHQKEIDNSSSSLTEQDDHIQKSYTNYEIVENKKMSRKRKSLCQEIASYTDNHENQIKEFNENNNTCFNYTFSKVKEETLGEEATETNLTVEDVKSLKKSKKQHKKKQDEAFTENNHIIGDEKLSKKKIPDINIQEDEEVVNHEIKSEGSGKISKKKRKIRDENVLTTENNEATVHKEVSKKKCTKMWNESKHFDEQHDEDSRFIHNDITQGSKKNKNKQTFDNVLPLKPPLGIEQSDECVPTLKTSKLERKMRKEELYSHEIDSTLVPVETFETQNPDLLKTSKKLKKEKNKEKGPKSQNETVNYDVQAVHLHPLKESKEYLEVLGRKTRLKSINIPYNPTKDKPYETEDFMSFVTNDTERCSLPVKAICVKEEEHEEMNNNTNTNTEYVKIHAYPTEHDLNVIKHIVVYEYRMLTAKLRQLKLVPPEIKVIIQDLEPRPLATTKKLRTLYKSKHLKTMLPQNELAEVEATVKKFAEEIEPSVNLMNSVVEMEEKTALIAQELMKESINQTEDSVIGREEKTKLLRDKVEALKTISNQLHVNSVNPTTSTRMESVSSENKSTADSAATLAQQGGFSESSHEILKKPMSSSQSSTNTLQTRIENKLKILTEQIKMLSEGKMEANLSGTLKNHTEWKSINNKKRNGSWNESRNSFKDNQRGCQRGKDNIRGGRGCHHFNNEGWGNDQETNGSIPFDSQGKYFGSERNNHRGHRGGNFMGPGRGGFMGRGRGGFVGLGRGGFMGSRGGSFLGRGGEGFMRPGRGGFMGRGGDRFSGPGRGGFMGVGGDGFVESGRDSFRGQGAFRGQGRSFTKVRGRISQNNLDAKMYAEKCKALNKVPELAFNGVDLKVISGYAANKLVEAPDTTTNISKTNIAPELLNKQSSTLTEVVMEKNRSADSLL